MAATLSAYTDALKQVWTQDRLEKQFYDDNPFLDKIEKSSRFDLGKEAVVPIEVNRNGGYSVTPSTGSSALNAAGEVGIDQATYNYTYHYQQVSLQHAAIVSTGDKAVSVANVIDTEMKGATSAIRKQLTRQLFGNGDALIAECTTTSASTTVNLVSTGYGYDAIVRKWLHKGLTVDIGTTADEGSVATDRVISSVSKSSSDPEIVISGAAVTTAAGDYVSIANSRSGTTSYEMNGLRNVVSTSATLGGLAVATQPDWAAASVDTSTTTLTLDVMYDAQEAVMQSSGSGVTYVLTSLKQQKNFYKLLQMQTRFDGDRKLGAGNVSAAEFAGMSVEAHPDCPGRQMWFLNPDDFLIVKSKLGPHWQSAFTGGRELEWSQGTTAYTGVLAYPINFAAKRRNRCAGLTALTA